MISRKRYLKLEAKAEMKAAIEVGSTSFNDNLRFIGLALACPSFEGKKNEAVSVRGQDIDNNSTWQKFLLSKGYIDASLISLTDDLERLTEEYDAWLDSFGDRYRNLDGEGKVWRYKACRLAVEHHIMQNKLAGQQQASDDEDEDYFASMRVAYYYQLLQTMTNSLREIAKLINHIVKEPEQADQLIDTIFTRHYERLRQTPFPQRDPLLRLIQPEPDDDDDTSTGVAL